MKKKAFAILTLCISLFAAVALVGCGGSGGATGSGGGGGAEKPAVDMRTNFIWFKVEVPEGVEKVDDLSELLRRADVVTLHCLLTDETRKLIDRERLALMKPTALLINCARGPIVDEDALIEALENGRLAGAGLDVTDPEPVAPDSPLFKLPNVIVTPHYAPTTVESATRVSKIAAENINAVLAGQEPVGCIV